MIATLFYFFIFSFITSYIIIRYFLIGFKTKKENKIDRWGISTKSHFGGLAFTVTIIFVLLFILIFNYAPNYYHISFGLKGLASEYKIFIGLLFVVIFTSLSGVLDEFENLQPITKLLLQTITGFLLIWSGFIIPISDNFIFNYVFTILWVVFISNAINMFDNIDLALISFSFVILIILIIKLFLNDFPIAYLIVSISYLGCFLCFSIFNFYPSKLFMGDVGSFQIGAILSALTIKVLWVDYEFESFKIGIYQLLLNNLIFLIIILDVILVFSIRVSKKRNPFKGDINHLSHNLQKIFHSPNISAGILSFLTLLLGIVFIFLSEFSNLTFINNFIILTVSYILPISVLSYFVLKNID
jgi:UDP-GlcNAc:undecaprenyl-phosphate GlcNAc-1-phosphate transferase